MLLGLLHITPYVERENIFFFSRTPLLRTLNLPPEGVRNNGSRLTAIKTFTYMKVVGVQSTVNHHRCVI